MIDKHQILTLDKCDVVELLVASLQHTLTETTSVDIDNRSYRLIAVAHTHQIVAHNHSHLLTCNGDHLGTGRGADISHLVTIIDILLSDAAGNLTALDNHCCAHRTLVTRNGRAHNGGQRVAMLGNTLQLLFAQLDKRSLVEQIVSGRTAQSLLGKDNQVDILLFSLFDSLDNLRSVALDITDGVVKLGKCNLHIPK